MCQLLGSISHSGEERTMATKDSIRFVVIFPKVSDFGGVVQSSRSYRRLMLVVDIVSCDMLLGSNSLPWGSSLTSGPQTILLIIVAMARNAFIRMNNFELLLCRFVSNRAIVGSSGAIRAVSCHDIEQSQPREDLKGSAINYVKRSRGAFPIAGTRKCRERSRER